MLTGPAALTPNTATRLASAWVVTVSPKAGTTVDVAVNEVDVVAVPELPGKKREVAVAEVKPLASKNRSSLNTFSSGGEPKSQACDRLLSPLVGLQ